MRNKLLMAAALLASSTFAATPVSYTNSELTTPPVQQSADTSKFSVNASLGNRPTLSGAYQINKNVAIEAGLSHSMDFHKKKTAPKETYKNSVYSGLKLTSGEKVGPIKPYVMGGAGYFFNPTDSTATINKKNRIHGLAAVGAEYELNEKTSIDVRYTRIAGANKNIVANKNSIGAGISFKF